jgi:peptidoglycan hydrolase-like protein with peptidoglycan-binding domain
MQSTISNPTLQFGFEGAKVKELQALLNRQASRDWQIVEDGIFGPRTEALVRTFQEIYFLEIDGIVGPKSWKSFYAAAPTDMPVLSRASQNKELVQRIQQALNLTTQPPLMVDGIFGSKTESALINVQQRSGREVDRNGRVVVGPKTWTTLSQQLAYFTFSL